MSDERLTDASKPGTIRRLAEVCEQVAATASKLGKRRLLAAYLAALDDDDLYRACTFLTGRALPPRAPSQPGVGGALLWKVVEELARGDTFFARPESEPDLGAAYSKFGDLGDAAAFLLSERSRGEGLLQTGAGGVPRTDIGSLPDAGDPLLADAAGLLHADFAGLPLADADAAFRELAATSRPREKLRRLFRLFERAGPLEIKYLIKILTGDLRIGARGGLLEEAVADATGHTPGDVRGALLRTGDIGEVASLARRGSLTGAPFRLFHPIGWMLASPLLKADEIGTATPSGGWMVEDKYDGIRAQVHKQEDEVRIFSRGMGEVQDRFPELVETLVRIPGSFLLDGEILAGDGLRILPFRMLQRRIGRRRPSPSLLAEYPCFYVAFDLLFQEGTLLFDAPLTERRRLLEALAARDTTGLPSHSPGTSRTKAGSLPSPAAADEVSLLTARDEVSVPAQDEVAAPIVQDRVPVAAKGEVPAPVQEEAPPPMQNEAPMPRQGEVAPLAAQDDGTAHRRQPEARRLVLSTLRRTHSPREIEEAFAAARARGNEGIVIKDPGSPYTPGRRGLAWRKLKQPLDTLDCLVVAAEYGHGKRHGWLSDYTFAVRDGGRLVTIAKAYSGLTDQEIQELTEEFKASTLRREGPVHWVEPRVVMEVAFDTINRSDRHTSGYALRFPRILRIRRDKSPEEIDTLQEVERIHASLESEPRSAQDNETTRPS